MGAVAGTRCSPPRPRAAVAGLALPAWVARRGTPTAAFAVAASATLFAPWSVLGTTSRSGLALAGAVTSAGLLPAGLTHLVPGALDALPAVVGGVCAAVVLGYGRTATVLAVAVGAVMLAASLAALAVPGVGVEAGPWLGIGVVAAGSAGLAAARTQTG